MTTAPSLRSSSDRSTRRPEILPFSSNTLNALNMSPFQLRLHLEPRVACFVNRTFVLDRRDVAGIAIEDHRLQHAAHQLPAARLRQHADEAQLADHRNRT